MRLVGFLLVAIANWTSTGWTSQNCDELSINLACAEHYWNLVDEREQARSLHRDHFDAWFEDEPLAFRIVVSRFESVLEANAKQLSEANKLWDEYLWLDKMNGNENVVGALSERSLELLNEVKQKIVDGLITEYPDTERVKSEIPQVTGLFRFEYEGGSYTYRLTSGLSPDSSRPQIELSPESTGAGSSPVSIPIRLNQLRVGDGGTHKERSEEPELQAFDDFVSAFKATLSLEIDPEFMARVEEGIAAMDEDTALAALRHHHSKVAAFETALEAHRSNYQTWFKKQGAANRFLAQAVELALEDLGDEFDLVFSEQLDLWEKKELTQNSSLKEALQKQMEADLEALQKSLATHLVQNQPEITLRPSGGNPALKLEFEGESYRFDIFKTLRGASTGPNIYLSVQPSDKERADGDYTPTYIAIHHYFPVLHAAKGVSVLDRSSDSVDSYEELKVLEDDPEFMRLVRLGQYLLDNRP